MDIGKNLSTISKKLSNYNAKLIPVIKNRTVEEVKEVYNCGFREFGENRLDDYFLHSDKFDDAVFHFIAPIQSRKIKVIFENFEFIHTVSRFKEIDLISKLDKKRKVLLQINIDKDPNKSGIDPDLIFFIPLLNEPTPGRTTILKFNNFWRLLIIFTLQPIVLYALLILCMLLIPKFIKAPLSNEAVTCSPLASKTSNSRLSKFFDTDLE